MYKVIATGSKGNAVIYHGSILVDCGVTLANIKPFLYDLSLVLLTHKHGDHIDVKTLKRLQFERPSLRIGCCGWMVELLEGLKNIDVYEIGGIYDYGSFSVSPIKLYHDIPNCGYRIFKDEHKIIHCTDTAHLGGITANNYNLYAIEHNYNEETIFDEIKAKKDKGEFSYQDGAINSHLSEQQARDFIFKNCGDNYEILRLHESSII